MEDMHIIADICLFRVCMDKQLIYAL